LQLAQKALELDFSPLSDLRASASYRSMVVRALLDRFWRQTGDGKLDAASAPSASVFSIAR
jgi:xanthine dehydrogenase small subunit